MTKNPFDIIKRASDILRALKKGVLVTAMAGDNTTTRQNKLPCVNCCDG